MPKKTAKHAPTTRKLAPVAPLLADLRQLIVTAREQVARTVDAGLVTLYWHVGRRIHQDILQQKRAEYGAEMVATVGRQLEAEFGRGWSPKSLRHMVRFAEVFPDEAIVSALRRQLGWSHLKSVIYLDPPLKRDFYAEMELAESGIHVASYWTEMLPKKELERKLHDAVLKARSRLRHSETEATPSLKVMPPKRAKTSSSKPTR